MVHYAAPTVRLIGNVEIGDEASLWDYVVVRADTAAVSIGFGTNIQEGAIVHVAPDQPCRIGDRVTVGHRAVLHGCRIGDDVLVGIGSIVLNGAIIGDGSIIAAGAVVTEGARIPDGSLVVGIPGRIGGPAGPNSRERARRIAAAYVQRAAGALEVRGTVPK